MMRIIWVFPHAQRHSRNWQVLHQIPEAREIPLRLEERCGEESTDVGIEECGGQA